MITFIKYARDLALESNVNLSAVTVTEGKNVGCLDTHLLAIRTEDGRQEYVLVYQSDIDSITTGKINNRLEQKLKAVFDKLRT